MDAFNANGLVCCVLPFGRIWVDMFINLCIWARLDSLPRHMFSQAPTGDSLPPFRAALALQAAPRYDQTEGTMAHQRSQCFLHWLNHDCRNNLGDTIGLDWEVTASGGHFCFFVCHGLVVRVLVCWIRILACGRTPWKSHAVGITVHLE